MSACARYLVALQAASCRSRRSQWSSTTCSRPGGAASRTRSTACSASCTWSFSLWAPASPSRCSTSSSPPRTTAGGGAHSATPGTVWRLNARYTPHHFRARPLSLELYKYNVFSLVQLLWRVYSPLRALLLRSAKSGLLLIYTCSNLLLIYTWSRGNLKLKIKADKRKRLSYRK